MSRISYKIPYKATTVEVVAGWDNPLNTFFLDVIDADDEDKIIYSSMSDPNTDASLDALACVLHDLDIITPENFWSMVAKKQKNNVVFLGEF